MLFSTITWLGSPPRRLVGALCGLVGVERLGRVDVAERWMAGEDVLVAGRLDAVALDDDRDERAHLHVADAREGAEPLSQVGARRRLCPHAAAVAVVVAMRSSRTASARARPWRPGSGGWPAWCGTPRPGPPAASRRCARGRGARAGASARAAPRRPSARSPAGRARTRSGARWDRSRSAGSPPGRG